MTALFDHEISRVRLRHGSFQKGKGFLENVRDIKGICLPRASSIL